ncbi:MAG: Ig-like domain-containing protein [Clostridia bacterium]|nr:Ig-like domain-containing protein [Clostridia bacterium]
MKKFIVYLLVIILTVSLGFAIFYLVRDNEIISISSASIYRDKGDSFTLDINHQNRKKSTTITVTSSDESVVSGSYNSSASQYNAVANNGGVARINVRTDNVKFRNLWCDVIVGDGTVESPYYISSVEQLAAIGMGEEITVTDENGVTTGTGVYYGGAGYEKYHSNLCYKLISDIDASKINNGHWVPLRHFSGRFDGNGMTISNIHIDRASYRNTLEDKADNLFTGERAGLFEVVHSGAVVYNFKLENYTANGDYGIFGTIAAENYGTIERIEVKDAYLAIRTGVLGGIVGKNETLQTEVVKTIEKEDGSTSTIEVSEREVARIDRVSVILTLGIEKSFDESTGSPVETIKGVSGVVGGLVGQNIAGTVVYSYVRGNVYFGSDAELGVTYGGIVGVNNAKNDFVVKNNDSLQTYQGAHIKDCYSDLRANYSASLIQSTIGGAIGVNNDVVVDEYKGDNLKVASYLIGIYYNKNNLNFVANEEDTATTYQGIGEFFVKNAGVDKDVTFDDTKTIVYGLTSEEMTNKENFVSHVSKRVVFNEDGISQGVEEYEEMWLFDTVWVIDNENNDKMPYLNYQLVYIPDDFNTVGSPVVTGDYDNYFYDLEVVYPISILSGVDGKLRIKVGEFSQLTYSPSGIEVFWSSSDEDIVEVDPNTGLIEGKSAGVATVTATTNYNSTATITVIVEKIAYSFTGPDTLYLFVNDTLAHNIELSPTPVGNDANNSINYTIADDSIIGLSADKKSVVAKKVGETTLTAEFMGASITCKVVVSEKPETNLALKAEDKNPLYITGYINTMQLNGTINITGNNGYALKATTKSGSGVVDYSLAGNTLSYTIKNIGTQVIEVTASGEDAVNKYNGSVYIYFTIKDSQSVTLTTSSSTIRGYYDTMTKNGTITVTNSASANLSYNVSTSNASVVTATTNGNSIKYSIIKTGTATLTITVATPNYQGTAYVYFDIMKTNVVVPTETISITSSLTIYQGSTATISHSGTNYTIKSWTSANNSIATVDSNGVVTGKGIGSTTITATTTTGKKAYCTVYVKAVSTVSLSITPATKTMYVGDTYQMTASGNWQTLTWSSSNNGAVTVDSNGLLTAVAIGNSTITAIAKDANGYTATRRATITVVERPVTISLAVSPSQYVSVTEQVTVTATLSDGSDAGNIVVSGSKSGSISSNFLGPNTITFTPSVVETITVTVTKGSASASVTIYVSEYKGYSKYIYNLAQLNAVRYYPNNEFIVMNDIDVSSMNPWIPIGTKSQPFKGKISGNTSQITISGINVTGQTYASLFGYTSGATISKLYISDSLFDGTYAGAFVARGKATISYCSVLNSTITAQNSAGGMIGYAETGSAVSGCTTSNCTITATKSSGACVGGVVGYATGATVNNCNVSGGKVQLSSSAHGYAGGIVGKLNATAITSALVGSANSVTISANMTDNDYAGGIVGSIGGTSATCSINIATVKSASIKGYYAGAVGGEMNISTSITLKFSTGSKGYRGEDLTTADYEISVNRVGVKSGVTVTGEYAGGLFAAVPSGVIYNCYTHATLKGYSANSNRAGFVVQLKCSSGFGDKGGTGTAGVVRYSYSAVTFAGSGNKPMAVCAGEPHQKYATGKRVYGFVMNYVFYDASGKAYYNPAYDYGLFSKDDVVDAKCSATSIKKANTYSGKGFSSSVWKITDGSYPTLKNERV